MKIDLVSAWSTFWSKIGASYTGTPIETVVTIIGIALIALTLLKFGWDKRRGGGAKQSPIWWTLALGGLLISPNVLIPAILRALQWVINLALGLLGNVTG